MKVIIIKRLLHLRSCHGEASLRLTCLTIPCLRLTIAVHISQKKLYEEVPPDKIVDKVI